MFQKSVRSFFVLIVLLMLAGCAASIKQGIYRAPDFRSLAINELVILPTVDLRIDKRIKVNLEKQIRGAAAKILKNKGYHVTVSDSLVDTEQFIDGDLRTADAKWIKRLCPAGSRYIMVLCLVDVATKLTFGSTGNAELAGYMYDKKAGIVIWRDKGIGQTGSGGLVGMAMKAGMDEQAISIALDNLLASIPERNR